MSDIERQVLDADEVAKMAGVSGATVRNRVRQHGHVLGVRPIPDVGRRILFSRVLIERALLRKDEPAVDPPVPESPGEGWITAPEAAERLGLQLSAVYRLIDEGKLQAEKFGERGSVRLRPADVDELIERARMQPKGDQPPTTGSPRPAERGAAARRA